jgi:hypothetical protein
MGKRTVLLLVALMCVGAAPVSAQNGFPFDAELILDVDPMPGSKRIPNMDVTADGAVALEMWCHRVEGRVVVAADTVTFIPGPVTERQCPPERAAADTELLSALTAVTGWRRDGHRVTLIGPRPLHFRLPSN